jgi:hypothetical protein
VIKRASWDSNLHRCGDLLDCAQGVMTDAEIESLERAQSADEAPVDKWKD